VICGSGEKLVG